MQGDNAVLNTCLSAVLYTRCLSGLAIFNSTLVHEHIDYKLHPQLHNLIQQKTYATSILDPK